MKLLHSSQLLVFADRKLIARHERLIAKDSCRLDLDHYLEVLIRKPGASPGSTALDQARQAGKFTPVHDARGGHGSVKPTGTRTEPANSFRCYGSATATHSA